MQAWLRAGRRVVLRVGGVEPHLHQQPLQQASPRGAALQPQRLRRGCRRRRDAGRRALRLRLPERRLPRPHLHVRDPVGRHVLWGRHVQVLQFDDRGVDAPGQRV